MKLPRFIPILTAFATRVTGCSLNELLQSPEALARALADTRKVVGHDGVLTVYHPSLLGAACLGREDAIALGWGPDAGLGAARDLRPMADALESQPVASMLESVRVLRHLLPPATGIFAALAGPGLLFRQLQDALLRGGGTGVDSGYVTRVILELVRRSFDGKADGIALIERTVPPMDDELLRVHRKIRKLADFYDGGLLVFDETQSPGTGPVLPAHCVFAVGHGARAIEPVTGQLDPSCAGHDPPVTTAADVPADTPVATLQTLARQQSAA